MQLGGLGSAVSSPSGVWGGAPAGSGAEPQRKSDLMHFLPENLTSDGTNFTNFIAEKCSILSYVRSITVISSFRSV